MGTGILATIGDTPKIANVSDAKESEQARRIMPPTRWIFAHCNLVRLSAHVRESAPAQLLDFPARKTYTAADMLRGRKSLS